MADDITNQQLLDALSAKFDGRFSGLEKRFDHLERRFDGIEGRFTGMEDMLAGVKDVVVGIADNTATSEELTDLKDSIRQDFGDLELRIGRRIDNALAAGNSSR